MYQRWPKRDPVKHYFMVPNEVFGLGLNSGEISIYGYLLRCEDRKRYKCYPSYRTIGRAVGLSENTVRKYVSSLGGRASFTPSRVGSPPGTAVCETAACSIPSVRCRRRWSYTISGSSCTLRRKRRGRG